MKGTWGIVGGAAPAIGSRVPLGGRLARHTLVTLLLVICAVLGTASITPSASAAGGTVATVVADGAPLLADVDDATVIDTMEYGARVDVLYGPYNGLYEILYYGEHGWTWTDKIAVDGQTGEASWSDAGAETESGAAAAGGAAVNWWSDPAWVVVNTDLLNVRADAGLWADVWDTYPGGTWVEVVGESVNGYAPIAYGDGVAWLAEQYLSWDGATTWNAAANTGVGGAWSSAEHWIDVDRSTGAVTLYIGDVAQATFWGSLGFDPSPDGFYSTAVGTYYVTRKYKDLAYTAYADGYITDWVAFDESRDNGFHSWTRDQYGNVVPWGAGKTGGCVALEPSAAAAVFDFAYVGMRVEIHD